MSSLRLLLCSYACDCPCDITSNHTDIVCWVAPRDVRSAAEAAAAGAEATRGMDSSAGRSNYVSAAILSGTPDPGAVAVAAVFACIAKHCCDSI